MGEKETTGDAIESTAKEKREREEREREREERREHAEDEDWKEGWKREALRACC